MNKILKNMKFNNLFTKKFGKQTVKNILIILCLLIVLLLGIYIGKLFNKEKEGFEIEDTSFFSSDAIMSVKEMDLNNITTTIEKNTTNIEQIKGDFKDYKGKNVMLAGTIIPYYPKNTTNNSTKLSNTDLTNLLLKGFVVCDSNSYNNNNHGIENICTIEIIDNFIIIKKDNTEIAKVPDLNRRFIVGAGAKSADNYNIGTTGGEEKHKLTDKESAMPGHDHKYDGSSTSSNGDHTHEIRHVTYGHTKCSESGGCNPRKTGIFQPPAGGGSIGTMYINTKSAGSHRHDVKYDRRAEAEQSHENRPPFMAMVYIYYLGDEYRYYEAIPEDFEVNSEKRNNAIFIQNLHSLFKID
jgi:microcystin-dependent protein